MTVSRCLFLMEGQRRYKCVQQSTMWSLIYHPNLITHRAVCFIMHSRGKKVLSAQEQKHSKSHAVY